ARACGNFLSAGASCVVSITFAPTTDGVANASIQVTSDQGGTADLRSYESRVGQILQFDPRSMDFGKVAVGTTSASQMTSLQNIGTGAATAIVFSNPGGGFSADASACGNSLEPGASCVVNVTFTPTTDGVANASIQVTSDQGSTADL